MLRRVELPEVPGRLLLHSMPGRFEPLDDFLAAARAERLTAVVCLVPTRELESKSAEYAALVRGETRSAGP